MCWRIENINLDKNAECYHKIADEDITVYKFGTLRNREFYPYFFNQISYPSKSLMKKIKLKLNNHQGERFIKEGYHGYSRECHLYNYSNRVLFYSKKEDIIECYSENILEKIIGKFIIPQGSEYYENEKGEIVSSQIFWTGESFPIYKLGCTVFLKDLDYVLENA